MWQNEWDEQLVLRCLHVPCYSISGSSHIWSVYVKGDVRVSDTLKEIEVEHLITNELFSMMMLLLLSNVSRCRHHSHHSQQFIHTIGIHEIFLFALESLHFACVKRRWWRQWWWCVTYEYLNCVWESVNEKWWMANANICQYRQYSIDLTSCSWWVILNMKDLHTFSKSTFNSTYTIRTFATSIQIRPNVNNDIFLPLFHIVW